METRYAKLTRTGRTRERPAPEVDALRPARDCGQHDPQLVGEHRLLDDVPDHLRVRRAGSDVAESVEAELNLHRISVSRPRDVSQPGG